MSQLCQSLCDWSLVSVHCLQCLRTISDSQLRLQCQIGHNSGDKWRTNCAERIQLGANRSKYMPFLSFMSFSLQMSQIFFLRSQLAPLLMHGSHGRRQREGLTTWLRYKNKIKFITIAVIYLFWLKLLNQVFSSLLLFFSSLSSTYILSAEKSIF